MSRTSYLTVGTRIALSNFQMFLRDGQADNHETQASDRTYYASGMFYSLFGSTNSMSHYDKRVLRYHIIFNK